MTRRLKDILRNEEGTTIVEFAVIGPLFFALFLGIIEVGLGFYWWKSAEKAAQLGARIAIVRDVAAPSLPARNEKTEDGILGQPCRATPSPCLGFAAVECTGAECTGPGFAMVLDRIQSVFPVIQAENIRIRYEYLGLGYAGGPAIPGVSVILTDVEYPFFMLGLIFSLFGGDGSLPETIPDIRVTLTGEDLSTSGP